MSIVNGRNYKKNSEGYQDPTAYEAIKRVSLKESNYIDKLIIENRQRCYPKGTKIRIMKMHDPIMAKHDMKIGYVDFVDDFGYVFIKFKGSRKGLRLSGLDEFERIE